MERAIRDTDRVLLICTIDYVRKANEGSGGVGYEKTIVTSEIMRNPKHRRKFIPVVRQATPDKILPTFFGSAYYVDLSLSKDSETVREALLRSIYEIHVSKPPLGSSPFISTTQSASFQTIPAKHDRRPSLNGQSVPDAFSDRFAQAFPGVRGVVWFDDSETVAQRLSILPKEPLQFEEGHLAS